MMHCKMVPAYIRQIRSLTYMWKKSLIKAILATVYNSYWIRIEKTDKGYRTDDEFDLSLSYENWADFKVDEDERK